MDSSRLPAWAKSAGTNRAGMALVDVDPDEFYPVFFAELATGLANAARIQSGAGNDKEAARLGDLAAGAKQAADGKPTQYWVEVAYQAMKMDVQVAVGFAAEIRVRSAEGRKRRWGLKGLPGAEDDVARATQGREARQHYRLIRGFLPAG